MDCGKPSPSTLRPQPRQQPLSSPHGLVHGSGPSQPSCNHIHGGNNSVVPVASSTTANPPPCPCGLVHGGNPSALMRPCLQQRSIPTVPKPRLRRRQRRHPRGRDSSAVPLASNTLVAPPPYPHGLNHSGNSSSVPVASSAAAAPPHRLATTSTAEITPPSLWPRPQWGPSPSSPWPQPGRQPLCFPVASSTTVTPHHCHATTSTAETTYNVTVPAALSTVLAPPPCPRDLVHGSNPSTILMASSTAANPPPSCGLVYSGKPSPSSRNNIHSRDNSAVPVTETTLPSP